MSEPPSPLSPPESPAEPDSSPGQSPPAAAGGPTLHSPLAARSTPDPTGGNMTHSSTPLGNVNAARRPVGASSLPSSMQAKMRAFHLSRQGAPPLQSDVSASPASPNSPRGPHPGAVPSGPIVGGMMSSPGGFRLPTGVRPPVLNSNSAPMVPKMPLKGSGGLAAKRGLGVGMKLSDATGPPPAGSAGGEGGVGGASKPADTAFSKYSDLIDTATGTLRFKGKATLHGSGIEFTGGNTFHISLDEVDTVDELGKGNYGTVYQVRHARPRIRRPGMGLAGNKTPSSVIPARNDIHSRNTSGKVMAMKEIRLELDDAKFAAIIMELDVLHRCLSPFIIDFYGAFFQEGAVYICMEYMDGGSIDKLYSEGIPEKVLRKVALSTVMGLKSLKDEHNIIHRDVKPTNVLVNSRGQVKICDFGVSGNLVASIAKTNIGCQSYMAPERISSGGVAQAGANPGGGTYSVQSDIWSLGLTLIECALGRYPYPPETYNNIFSQLSAIVDGDPPDLPREGYSDAARDFVRSCLHKKPMQRPTYAALLRHPWFAPLLQPASITEDADAEAEAEAEAAIEAQANDSAQASGSESTPVNIAAQEAAALAAEDTTSPIANESLTPTSPPADGLAHAVAVLLSPTSAPASSSEPAALALDTSDADVAAWVRAALARRRDATAQKSPVTRPALHTVNLEAVNGSSSVGDSAAAPSEVGGRS